MAAQLLQESVLIEAIMSTRQQIDFLWQVFITVHIAVFAMLFIYGEVVDDLTVVIRIFALTGMVIFDWINGKALTLAYLLLDAMQDQYRTLYGQADRFQPKFYEQFVLAQYSDRPNMVLLTHGLALLVVAFALMTRRMIDKAPR